MSALPERSSSSVCVLSSSSSSETAVAWGGTKIVTVFVDVVLAVEVVRDPDEDGRPVKLINVAKVAVCDVAVAC